MNGIKKNDNLQSNKSSPISNEKTPQKTEEDKIVWFTSPPIEKLKYAKLNSGKSTIKPETEISNIVKLIRKTEGLNNNNDSNENQREKILSQNSISNIWTNEISVNSNSSNLNSPSFHKHSHCLDSLFSPINKKSKLNHWNNGFKGKYLKKDIFSKKGSMLDIENSLLFKKDRSNNFIDKNKNIFIYNNDTESNNNLLHNSNSSIQKKERIKSEPNLYHSPEAEINKKNIRIPKYNTLLNFEKIPFNKTNINFEQLNNTIFSDDSILGKRKYKDIDTSKNDTKDGKNINMIDYTIYKNQENKVLDILKLESNNNINNSNNSNNNELSNSSNKENSKINNNTNNENLMDISRINKVNKGKERSYESYEYNNKLNYKGFNINEEEENNKNIKSQHNANNDIIGVNNELLSASSIKNVFNNKKVKVELSENKNESLGSSILFSSGDKNKSNENNINKNSNKDDIINNDMKTDIKQENYCKKNDDFDDEFGFFDINIFNEEISEIVSKYDNVNNPLSQTGNPKSDLLQNNILNDKDDDDENIKKKKYFRFLVIEVLIKNDRKELRLYDKDNYSYESYAILCDEWYNTNVSPGNYVNIIGEFDENSHRCYITNDKNIIIVNPDVLLSVTIASSGYRCIRKPVLDNRVHSDEMNSNLVYGIILHELLQIAFQNNNFTTEFLDKSVTKLISKNIEKLYCIDETEDTAYTTLKEMIPKYQTWASTYVSSHPKSDAFLRTSNERTSKRMCINKLFDIEENIWSPMYGLKGKIDASVQIKVTNNNSNEKAYVVPLELKTGHNSDNINHRAQTIIYTLLMSDRYDINVLTGLLYYLKKERLIYIPVLRNEIRSIIMNRNRIAYHVMINDSLPPPIQNSEYKCRNCYKLQTCSLYHKLYDKSDDNPNNVYSILEKETFFLTKKHAEFFKQWEQLITNEDEILQQFKKEIWCLKSDERQTIGRCFSNMKIIKEECYKYYFERDKSEEGESLLNYQLNIGDPVVISSEEDHFAIGIGFITELNSNYVAVSIGKPLLGIPIKEKDFNKDSNQNFKYLTLLEDTKHKKTDYFNNLFSSQNSCSQRYPMLSLSDNNLKRHNSQITEDDSREKIMKKLLYRIDKDEMSSGINITRNNLLDLFRSQDNNNLRKLIVDLEIPKFNKKEMTIPKNIAERLDPYQKNAVEKALSAIDYSLILGMPGTGKTTTITALIEILIKNNKKVLITSYTNTAVDNILLKLQEKNIDFFRVGNIDKIHPSIHRDKKVIDESIDTVKKLETFYKSKNIFATTCLGSANAIFKKFHFDYCIVDEASQITLPITIGPLKYAKTFVLVGDHYQLPPLMRSSEARNSDLSSLFKHLSEAHPEAVSYLKFQYRMNKEIMKISNQLIYNYKLRCGTEEARHLLLEIPEPGKLDEIHRFSSQVNSGSRCLGNDHCWIKHVLNPNNSVIFLNTDKLDTTEDSNSNLIYNETESEIILQIVKSLKTCGIPNSSIGIISPYRAQVKQLHTHFKKELKSLKELEIHTVDKFQGKDKDCIIVSLVRSNKKGNIGMLLKDWRRINVTFTRAKRKLIVVGSIKTLEDNYLFKEFFELVNDNYWNYDLPKNFKDSHEFIPETVKNDSFSSDVENRSLSDRNLYQREKQQAIRQSQARLIIKKSQILSNIIDEY